MHQLLLWRAVHLLHKRPHLFTLTRGIFDDVWRDSENAGLMAELNEQNRSSRSRPTAPQTQPGCSCKIPVVRQVQLYDTLTFHDLCFQIYCHVVTFLAAF